MNEIMWHKTHHYNTQMEELEKLPAAPDMIVRRDLFKPIIIGHHKNQSHLVSAAQKVTRKVWKLSSITITEGY